MKENRFFNFLYLKQHFDIGLPSFRHGPNHYICWHQTTLTNSARVIPILFTANISTVCHSFFISFLNFTWHTLYFQAAYPSCIDQHPKHVPCSIFYLLHTNHINLFPNCSFKSSTIGYLHQHTTSDNKPWPMIYADYPQEPSEVHIHNKKNTPFSLHTYKKEDSFKIYTSCYPAVTPPISTLKKVVG